MNTKIIHKIRLRLTFVLFAVVLSLVSFKVSAINLSANVSYLGSWSNLRFNAIAGVGACNYVNNELGGYAQATTSTCSPDWRIWNLNGLAWNKDYILEIPVYMYDLKNDSLISAYENIVPTLYVENPSFMAENIGSYFNLQSTSSAVAYFYFRLNNGIEGTQYFNSNTWLHFLPKIGINQGEFITISSRFNVLAFNNANSFSSTEIVNAINQARTENNAWQSQINQNIQEVRQAILNSQGSVNNINNNIENSIDQTQQASDEGNTNADNANTDNENASQNLIQVAGTVIGAFASSATNCSLNADMGNVNLGTINFCTDKPSAIIGVIDAVATILIAFAVYRIIRSLINRFISLTSYGQGGSDG